MSNFYTETENGINIEANELNINCLTSKNNKFHLDNDGNLTVNSITTVNSSSDIFNQIYPIGSIYMSITNTNPSTLFVGTWEQIKDTFLLASGDTYTAGSTGGEATHTLTVSEMPNHTHTAKAKPGAITGTSAYLVDTGGSGAFGVNSYTGGNQPHNNMPPYLSVYMWKRIS